MLDIDSSSSYDITKDQRQLCLIVSRAIGHACKVREPHIMNRRYSFTMHLSAGFFDEERLNDP